MTSILSSRSRERSRLVESIAARGVTDPAVLAAIGGVPREAFVPAEVAEFAYRDAALPIGVGQTISPPYVVALTTQALQLDARDRVLEIGTGSGYAAAVLAELAAEVFTVERHGELASAARERLVSHGVHNVMVHHADGRYGWPDYAPYDAIVVPSATDVVPERLRGQLVVGGRLVVPVGAPDGIQKLVRIRRTGPDDFEEETLQ
ncbi:protein-L-isoaspartate(D-aspartate) O-methyltransferase [Kribbella sp. C-35]|uniref:protein-L-isoaspartate(D-aspartate) O-methyltransferase n=1 Tax=Kribbella sp. C-35 TaxID=2789276 RepID=UPI00397BAC2F